MTAQINKRPGAIRGVIPFGFRHWLEQPARSLTVAGGLVGATAADLFMPLFSGRLVDALTQGASDPAARRAALFAFGGIVALGAVSMVLRLIGLQAIVPFTLKIMSDVSRDAFMRVQRFSTDWHANSFAGSTVRKITRGMWALDLLNDTILMALAPSLTVLLGSMILLGLHWPSLGAVIAVGTLIYVSMTMMFSVNYIAPAARVSNAWDTKVGGTLADALTCNAVVKSFGAEAREDARLAGVIGRWRVGVRRTWLRYNYPSTAQLAVLLCFRASVIGGAILLWIAGRASPGDVTYVLTSYYIIHAYLRDGGMPIKNLKRSVNDREDWVAIHGEPIGIADAPDARPIDIQGGRIVFDGVTFLYGGHREPLYDGLSVDIRAGERVGLVGRSGSGKTTFVKLGQRLYDVSGGKILIDGQDIAKATQHSLRSQIAIVQQDPILFHRTLAENIAYGRPGASMAAVEQAARLANAHDFILRLPKGYGTLVGERGVKLSGGERQRVAPARAFLADVPVLILDEATSSFDSESEGLIQQAMERLMKGRTSIVIAHRLSTVRSLDRILVFDHGKIVEQGTHATLTARQGGIYRGLFERQATEFDRISAAEEVAVIPGHAKRELRCAIAHLRISRFRVRLCEPPRNDALTQRPALRARACASRSRPSRPRRRRTARFAA